MITSDVIALSALLLSVFSMIGSAIVYISGLRRERRTATLNAFNVLQEQVLDHLNLYTRKRVEEISASPRSEEYKLLSGYLARLEHFAVGINTGIYDVQVVKRLAGWYLCGLQDKIDPLIQKKRQLNRTAKHYDELEAMLNQMRSFYRETERRRIMSKFVIDCPNCGKFAEARTGFFARKKIDCTCGNTIDVRTERLATRKCPKCGNTVIYDQSKGEKALCPVCHEPINTTALQLKTVEFS